MMSSLKEVNKLLYNIILYVCISSVWLWASRSNILYIGPGLV
jgi:hypothetical protein